MLENAAFCRGYRHGRVISIFGALGNSVVKELRKVFLSWKGRVLVRCHPDFEM